MISPTNQHTPTTAIKDKLVYDNYYAIEFKIFKENVENAFPTFDGFDRFVKQLHDKASKMREQHDNNYVNQFIESALLSAM